MRPLRKKNTLQVIPVALLVAASLWWFLQAPLEEAWKHSESWTSPGLDPRLRELVEDERLPLVFMDVEIKGQRAGRIEAVLFADKAPRHAENFRRLMTGEAGVVPPGVEGEGTPLHLKGASFYRIIDQFIDQAGINTPSAINPRGAFDDDEGGLALKHEYKGLLSSANTGPNTNTAHFSIMMNPAPHLDGSYTVFGQVVSGMEVVDAINALSRDKPDKTATAEDGAVIADCGQLRKGSGYS